MAISVGLATLGCKVNQAESEELRQRLEAGGCLVTDIAGEAQVYVINTCTVTHIADRKSRNMVQRACRANPQARVLVTGCYARRAPLEIETSPQVRVVPNGTAEDLASHLQELDLPPTAAALSPAPSTPRRSRSTIKVQDGCDQFCAFCAVPLARGRSRSVPLEDVARKIRRSVQAGFREVALTGVNLTYYGKEWGGSLGELLDIALEAGPERLRLSSLQPEAIDDGLLRRWRDPRLCRHFHLALQSGSEAVLRRMGRRYTASEFQAAVGKIREAIPGASVTTDVMVGFPGETPAEFAESYNFCRDSGFARMHVFQYSRRPGAAASRLPGSVPSGIKASRSREMLDLASKASTAFRLGFLGNTLDVLFEEESKDSPGYWRGHADNYLEVEAPSETPLSNQVLPVNLSAVQGDIILGIVDLGRRR